MPPRAASISIVCDPSAPQWGALLKRAVRAREADSVGTPTAAVSAPSASAGPGESPTPARRVDLHHAASAALFRRELGLPVDRPIVMTGHQALWWHPGILAKYFACDAACRAFGAAPAWLVVDQAVPEYHEFAVPTSRDDGVLQRSVLTLTAPPHAEAASGSCPAFTPAPIPANLRISPEIREHIERVRLRLQAHSTESSAARQTARAVADELRELGCEAPMLFATDLNRTSFMRAIAAEMQRDPAACARAYNHAVRQFVEADLAPMREESTRVELPLWRVRAGRPRQRVFSDELAGIDPAELAPRAILMTGLIRAAGCDLFIHGKGGSNYDGAAEAWLRDWLGLSLAPMVVVSADLRLQFEGSTPSAQDVAKAAWRAHAAKHDPRVVGDEPAYAAKARALEAVRAARATGADAGPAYREMHAVIARYRARRAAEIAALDRDSARIKAAWDSRAVREDRTWSFALHQRDSLLALGQEVSTRFSQAR